MARRPEPLKCQSANELATITYRGTPEPRVVIEFLTSEPWPMSLEHARELAQNLKEAANKAEAYARGNGRHVKPPYGRCPICGHCGSDCKGAKAKV